MAIFTAVLSGIFGRTIANNPAKIGIATSIASAYPGDALKTVTNIAKSFRKK